MHTHPTSTLPNCTLRSAHYRGKMLRLAHHSPQWSAGMALRLMGPFLWVVILAEAAAGAERRLVAGDYEALPVFEAKDLHPDWALSGRHHRVGHLVSNDGRWNRYVIESEYGEQQPASAGELELRLAEFTALETLEDLDRSQAFRMGAKDTAVDVILTPYKVVRRVVLNPLYALEAVPKEIFQYAGVFSDVRQLFREGIRAYAKDVIGYDSAVKDLARSLEINYKTQNPDVREALEHDAWGYWGGYAPLNVVGRRYMPSVDVATEIGNVGTGNVGGAVREINRMIRPRSERRQLKRMGVSKEDRRAYTSSLYLAEGRHELITKTAFQMKDALNRDEVIYTALKVDGVHEGIAVCESVLVLARYHHVEQPLAGLIAPGGVLAGVAQDGTVIVPWTYDHVVWTASIEEEVAAALADLRYLPGTHPVEIWSLGGMSGRVKTELEARAITVVMADRAEWTEIVQPKGPIARMRDRAGNDTERPAADALRLRTADEPIS